MVNVGINDVTLRMITEKGFYFEHETDMIKIRDSSGKIHLEIIYLETNNSIIVIDNKEAHYAKQVKINRCYERIVLFLYDEYGRNSGKVEISLK